MVRRPLVLVLAMCSCAWAAKPRTGRDWSKLSDDDWRRIEEEWETPEEKEEYEYKPPKQKGIDMEKLQATMKKKGKRNQAKVQARRMALRCRALLSPTGTTDPGELARPNTRRR
jgi:hypothetical protein